jgi:hypothetical protein
MDNVSTYTVNSSFIVSQQTGRTETVGGEERAAETADFDGGKPETKAEPRIADGSNSEDRNNGVDTRGAEKFGDG